MHEQHDGQLLAGATRPAPRPELFSVHKRDGVRVLPPFFDVRYRRIQLAIEFAFKAEYAGVNHRDQPAARRRVQNNVIRVANDVIHAAIARIAKGDALEIEFIQDLVETQLMEAGHHSIARRYILYREERRKASRAAQVIGPPKERLKLNLFVSLPDNQFP